jgi:peptide chain release factor 2
MIDKEHGSYSSILDQVKLDIECLNRAWSFDTLLSRIQSLDIIIAAEDFWNNPQEAARIMKEKSLAESRWRTLSDYYDQFEMYSSEEDYNLLGSVYKLAEDLAGQKLKCLFTEIDEAGCFLQVRAGAGGLEARDWAKMLFRMYFRYAQKAGYKVEIIEESVISDLLDWGMLKITPTNSALYPYGYLKHECGSHRLVRMSPFDSSGSRHTSFVGVDVFPVSDKTIQIEIEKKDLEILYCRASGAGGQHVNKTDSAVRVRHIPTNIVAECQNDRSQHKNLEQAMTVLKSRLYANELNKQKQSEQERIATRGDISWGYQVRSYVLQPYQLVTDLRTRHEESNAHRVLDGDIQGFLDSAIMQLNQKDDEIDIKQKK